MKTKVLRHPSSRPLAGHAVEDDSDTLTAKKTTITIVMAIAFLALVMTLSYLFITGTK